MYNGLTKETRVSKTRAFFKETRVSKKPGFHKKPCFKKTRVPEKTRVFQKHRYSGTRVSKVFKEDRFSRLTLIMADNTLGEWSDGDDNWIFDVNENSLWEWSDSEDDEIIRSIEENDQTGRGGKRSNRTWRKT